MHVQNSTRKSVLVDTQVKSVGLTGKGKMVQKNRRRKENGGVGLLTQ